MVGTMEGNIMTIKGMSVAFGGHMNSAGHVLRDINLDIREGEFICVLGPSGCGKTTLLNCVAGFQEYVGEIEIYGNKVVKPGKERGVMFQEYGLFPWFTVEQNIAFGPKMSGTSKNVIKQLVDKYLKLIDLENFRHHYPNSLSGGMRQRVSLARALANSPSFLLMDEPFAALDEQTRHILQEELLKIWEQDKITCFFVTHSLSEAVFLADRIVILTPNPGRVAYDIRVEMPRMRRRNDEKFLYYQNQLELAMKGEV